MSVLLKTIRIMDNKVVVSDPVVTIYSMSYDGHLANTGSSYPTVRTATSAQYNGTSPDPLLGPVFTVGQYRKEDGSGYWIYRGFLFFDTSAIPTSATINNASIILNVAAVGVGPLYQDYIIVKNGQPTYPRMPVQLDDYYIYRYSGVGGQLWMANCVAGAPIEIQLDDTGKSWINKGGITKLALFSQNDDQACAPSGAQVIMFYQSEAGLSYAPYLFVEYTSGAITGQIVDVKLYNPSTGNFDLTSPPTVAPGQRAGAMVFFKNTSGFTINMWAKFTFKRPNGSVVATQDYSYSRVPLTNNSVGSQGFAYYTDTTTGQWLMDIEVYGEE